MPKNNPPGTFFVIEGPDGSGKSTQLKLLIKRLMQESYEVMPFDFPQHGKRSAALVDDYLNGKYGSAQQVGPYRASIFFACDRYDASFKIRKWLAEGKIVVCDRYLGSNIGHQGGKISNERDRQKFISWDLDLEYNIFNIPKPDINFIFNVPPKISLRLADSKTITDKAKLNRRRAYLGKKGKDIHEKDINHLKDAFRSYMEAVKDYPKDYKLVDCLDERGNLLPPEIIHQRIWDKVKKII